MLENKQISVLQDWISKLPLREQGTLLTAVRGCDLAPKSGEETPERGLHAFFRYCILNPADPREVDVRGAWFRSAPPANWKPSQLGHYPLHWYSHLMHAFEVVGYRHPDVQLAHEAFVIYTRLARALHLTPETRSDFESRLSEDRIAGGSVVS